MSIKSSALAVSCKTVLEMESDHFLVYRTSHITNSSIKNLCLDNKNAAVLTTPLWECNKH